MSHGHCNYKSQHEIDYYSVEGAAVPLEIVTHYLFLLLNKTWGGIHITRKIVNLLQQISYI